MDTKDWDGFAQVFAPDAVMDMSSEMRDGTTEGSGITHGQPQIAAFVRSAVDAVQTVHHGHMPEIESDVAHHRERDLGDGGQAALAARGRPSGPCTGTVITTRPMRSLMAEWRIKTITLTRLRVDAEMA